MTESTKERLTIMIDRETATKVRKVQSKQIVDSNESVSFSRVITALVRVGLKTTKDSMEPLNLG